MHPAIDRQVVARRLQVLADGQDVRLACGADVVHQGEHLVVALTDPHHDAGLGDQSAALELREHRERSLVLRLRTHRGVHAVHRLHVVGEDLRPRIAHRLDGLLVAEEVAHQAFDAHPRACLMDTPDGLGPDLGAAVGKLVAVDAGDHHVLQLHERQALRHAARFVGVEDRRTPGLHVAEAARARARVTEDHDGGSAAAPAFAHVRAACFLADGVQPMLVDDALQALVARTARHTRAQPVRLATDGAVLRRSLDVVQHHAGEAHHRGADAPCGVATERARMPRQCACNSLR